MSYARWGCDGSSVYVFASAHEDGGTQYICMQCKLAPVDVSPLEPLYTDHTERTPGAMLEHLARHAINGDTVPDSAFERLREEADET